MSPILLPATQHQQWQLHAHQDLIAAVSIVNKLIEDLTRAGPNPVALNEHIFSVVDGIIGTVVFGRIYGTEQFKMPFLNMLGEAMDMLGSFCAEDFLPNMAGRLIDRLTGLVARRDRIFKRLDAFFDAVIDDHLNLARSNVEEEERRSDLVQALIELWKGNGNAVTFTRDHVKAMLFGMRKEDISMQEAGSLAFHKKTPLILVIDFDTVGFMRIMHCRGDLDGIWSSRAQHTDCSYDMQDKRDHKN
ncbi:hypothetical protein EJB05_41300, partial [Eragrostis curvula]